MDAHIHTFRGMKVMLDNDLAAYYGVPTRVLNNAVQRVISRFPDEFMFQLAPDETDRLRVQHGEHEPWIRRLHRRPYAFTEQGIHAISYFLHSTRAIKMSVELIKSFHSMRTFVDEQKDIYEIIREMKRRQDVESKRIWNALRSIRELEEFREEASLRFTREDRDLLNVSSREKIDMIRCELEQIEQRALKHRDLFYMILMIFGALLTALILFPR